MKSTQWDYSFSRAAFLLLISFSLMQCSPVKKVMKDPEKVREVFEQGLKSGIVSCVTDTTLMFLSDTTIVTDTAWVFNTDTLSGIKTIETVKTIPVKVYVNKTITIRDTVVRTVRDVTLINLLRSDVLTLKEDLQKQKEATSRAIGLRNKWRLYFFILLTIFGVYLFRKPLWRIISPKLPFKL